MSSIRRLKNNGDTIIEVLISIAVVSTVLAGAFVSASRSLSGGQQSQERTEAVRFTEEQLEHLKVQAAVPANTVFTIATSFCFDINGVQQSMTSTIGSLDTDTTDYLTPGCVRPPTPSNRYNVGITRIATNTFQATTRWDRAGGGGRDEVKIIYRVYP